MHGVGFVHSPLLRRPARVSNELIHVSDWYPTMMSLAGLSGNHTRLRLDGVDQWDTIRWVVFTYSEAALPLIVVWAMSLGPPLC